MEPATWIPSRLANSIEAWLSGLTIASTTVTSRVDAEASDLALAVALDHPAKPMTHHLAIAPRRDPPLGDFVRNRRQPQKAPDRRWDQLSAAIDGDRRQRHHAPNGGVDRLSSG